MFRYVNMLNHQGLSCVTTITKFIISHQIPRYVIGHKAIQLRLEGHGSKPSYIPR
mgnify:CR=1 FL=1